ncbi:protein YIPF3 [Bemisia tabaci]|uniref:protein YIPF3 n=1 Tax=Bemisia tabaci TaxID=7038 RepID=UPI003B27C979
MTRKKHSVIFIGNTPEYDNPNIGWQKTKFLKKYFSVSPRELPRRVFNSFVPPFISSGKTYRVHVDFVGPCLALLILNGLLSLGHSYKSPSASVDTAPFKVLLLYSIFTPVISYFLAHLCESAIKFSELVALFGYGLYGHIFTLILPLLLSDESSNVIFAMCLVAFSGMSTLRIALVFLTSIPKPIFRLLLCSVVAINQILSVLFLHFLYMHRTFVYAASALDYE